MSFPKDPLLCPPYLVNPTRSIVLLSTSPTHRADMEYLLLSPLPTSRPTAVPVPPPAPAQNHDARSANAAQALLWLTVDLRNMSVSAHSVSCCPLYLGAGQCNARLMRAQGGTYDEWSAFVADKFEPGARFILSLPSTSGLRLYSRLVLQILHLTAHTLQISIQPTYQSSSLRQASVRPSSRSRISLSRAHLPHQNPLRRLSHSAPRQTGPGSILSERSPGSAGSK